MGLLDAVRSFGDHLVVHTPEPVAVPALQPQGELLLVHIELFADTEDSLAMR